ncbi:MAG: nitroreductase family deazaflavin-dependent oxidoreductase [Acidimicrobiia bacterium]
MRLTTTGRRTGHERKVILGYYEDGPNLVTMAMNGWANEEPAWWLNLQAHSVAAVVLGDGRRTVRGRAAEGEERSRLWARWNELNQPGRVCGAPVHRDCNRHPGTTAQR